MANQQNSEHDNFAERRIAALNEPEGFQPNAAHANIRLRSRLASQSRSLRVKWTTAAVTAALVVFVALSSTRASAMNPDQPPQFFQGFALHIHSALYAHWRGLMAMLYGAEAPDFELADASGKTIHLSDYQGKVVLLNFWATWCAPCKEEIPGFMDLQKQFGDDLVVLGIALDEDGWTSVRPYTKQTGITYPIMVNDPSLPRPYRKIESVPTTFLIGRNGRIARIQNTLAKKSDYEDWITGLVGTSLHQQ